ncbi:MAG: hypothetical protein LBV41_12565 [Cytophagaceae bacterium]|nr:hypothetical protein [Cytophagaceae bacterium]
MKLLEGNFELFTDEEKSNYEHIISSIGNNQIQVIDPELIYGRLSDNIGYNRITNRLFSHLVITRLYI